MSFGLSPRLLSARESLKMWPAFSRFGVMATCKREREKKKERLNVIEKDRKADRKKERQKERERGRER